MARLTAEEKALLARILEAEDDEEEDPEPEAPADEFTYQGKRYVFTPEELEEVQEEEPPTPVKKVPVKKAPSAPRTPKPEPDPEPEEARRRFHT
jgi:hypothetical protein